MYKFYDTLRTKFGEAMTLLYTDTDSFIVHIETRDVYEDIGQDEELCGMFDFTDVDDRDHPCKYNWHYPFCSGVPGKFKDETKCDPIIEFVGLRPKMYSYKKCKATTDRTIMPQLDESHRIKGIGRAASARLSHADFVNEYRAGVIAQMDEDDPARVELDQQMAAARTITQCRIGTKLHEIYGIEQHKRALCAFDDKRILIGDQEDGPTPWTLAYGSYHLPAIVIEANEDGGDHQQPPPMIVERRSEAVFAEQRVQNKLKRVAQRRLANLRPQNAFLRRGNRPTEPIPRPRNSRAPARQQAESADDEVGDMFDGEAEEDLALEETGVEPSLDIEEARREAMQREPARRQFEQVVEMLFGREQEVLDRRRHRQEVIVPTGPQAGPSFIRIDRADSPIGISRRQNRVDDEDTVSTPGNTPPALPMDAFSIAIRRRQIRSPQPDMSDVEMAPDLPISSIAAAEQRRRQRLLLGYIRGIKISISLDIHLFLFSRRNTEQARDEDFEPAEVAQRQSRRRQSPGANTSRPRCVHHT